MALVGRGMERDGNGRRQPQRLRHPSRLGVSIDPATRNRRRMRRGHP